VTKGLSSTYRVPIAIGRQKTSHRDAPLEGGAGARQLIKPLGR